MMSRPSLYYIVWKEGKFFVSQCLNVDISSFGSTRAEAIANLNEVMELYLEEPSSMPHEMIENKEIPLGTFRSILRQSQMHAEAFEES